MNTAVAIVISSAFLVASLVVAFAEPRQCSVDIHNAMVSFQQTVTQAQAGKATRIDVENARIRLLDNQINCQAISRKQYCLRKNASLNLIIRILQKNAGAGHADQASLNDAQTRQAQLVKDCTSTNF